MAEPVVGLAVAGLGGGIAQLLDHLDKQADARPDGPSTSHSQWQVIGRPLESDVDRRVIYPGNWLSM
jgi:hypothetical protein